MKNFCILIPAYNPSHELIDLIANLMQENFLHIIVVNDGSDVSSTVIFDTIRQKYNNHITLLEHSVNLGKGAALKTGLNYAYLHYPSMVGVVTADADGQHLVSDIIKVGERLLTYPDRLILGARQFGSQGNKVPLRSKIGNLLTIKLFAWIVGKKITDTQSGLRGIPKTFISNLLMIPSNGYEFELSMLIDCKFLERAIDEVPIKTVYIENNKSSHFNPFIDSLKIYFVLFRFILLSISSAILDFFVFSLLSFHGTSVFISQLVARNISVAYNYPLAKKMVFRYQEKHKKPFFKYIVLVLINCVISLIFIDFFVKKYSFSPVLVKAIIESLLFLANFAIQRDFIFVKNDLIKHAQ